MRAQLLIERRDVIAPNAFVELALWRVPQPVRGSAHGYKYRLAYVVDGVCVLRMDNEAGKGDHKHVGGAQTPVTFDGPAQLLAQFKAEIERFNDENRSA